MGHETDMKLRRLRVSEALTLSSPTDPLLSLRLTADTGGIGMGVRRYLSKFEFWKFREPFQATWPRNGFETSFFGGRQRTAAALRLLHGFTCSLKVL